MDAAPRSMLERGVRSAEQGQLEPGLALIRAAIDADPSDPEAHAQLGRWLVRAHRVGEALAAAGRALDLAPQEARTFDTVGVVLSHGGRHERAVECFARAAGLSPGQAGYRFNLASSLKFLGRFAEAEAAYEACLAADPRHWRAHSALAQLRVWTPAENHVRRLQALLAEPALDVDAELHLRHALAKELDDLGRHDESFAQLAAGRARKRAATGYDFAVDAALFEAAARAFTEVLPAGAPGQDPTQAPIFVVGMPRTGTTLVERILASHDQVDSAGESQNFPVLLKRAAGTPGRAVLDPQTLACGALVDLGEVGRAYLASTRPPGAAPRFVDKLPLNFFFLGHIAQALPGARLVVLRRHALDTIVANFGQLFATTLPYYRYALDLRDTARYWLAFDALVAHWRQVLPGRVHEVHYEALVEEPRREVATLLDHCGLGWEEGCLAFDRHPGAVATASAVQVRQPFYRSSVGRWRRHAAHLAPAIEVLSAGGKDVGRLRQMHSAASD